MNKRARLTRRILREHRQGWPWHRAKLPDGTYHHWNCPHCDQWARTLIDGLVADAYR